MRWPRTIKARLTLWGALSALFVCGVVCIVLYAGLALSLRREVDAFLSGETDELVRFVRDHPDSRDLSEFIRNEVGGRSVHDLAFRLFDDSGRLLATSEAEESLDAVWSSEAWSDQGPRLETAEDAGTGQQIRTCSRPIRLGNRRLVVQASYALDHMHDSLITFRWLCFVGLGLAAVLAVASGHLVAKRGLRPLRIIVDKAECIGGHALSDRIPRPGTEDELDRLVITLNGMLDRIEGYVRELERFTADAAHELRTPLAGFRGKAEVALSGPRSNERLRDALADGIEQCDRLARIADDLLLLARADAGAETVQPQAVRLDSLVADVVDLYAPIAEDAGVRLTCRVNDESGIEADPGRLRQLTSNLIDNAIRHTPPGGQVDVSLGRANGVVELRIEDTGRGVAAEHLPHIFKRFYRADPARSDGGGAGLGLAISQTIARAHGGRIDVQSTEGRGTAFTVTLPAAHHLYHVVHEE